MLVLIEKFPAPYTVGVCPVDFGTGRDSPVRRPTGRDRGGTGRSIFLKILPTFIVSLVNTYSISLLQVVSKSLSGHIFFQEEHFVYMIPL